MNFYKILILVLFSLLFESHLQACNNFGSLDTIKSLCTIEKIKKSKANNVIFARIEQNDALIVILSKNDCRQLKDFNKIECGKKYSFVLFPLFDVSENTVPMLVDVAKYEINGKKIKIRGKHYIYEVYTSPNLKGLFYSEINEVSLTP